MMGEEVELIACPFARRYVSCFCLVDPPNGGRIFSLGMDAG